MNEAMFDRSGYYALARPGRDGAPLPRQLDFHGGLRWRFEEHIPADRRRIDRIALFRSQPGLKLLPDHRFNIEEYNTYSCPWHHNITAAIASFRVAKALVRNPGSRDQIQTFTWRNSHPFRWHSQQLMDLGLMEPGPVSYTHLRAHETRGKPGPDGTRTVVLTARRRPGWGPCAPTARNDRPARRLAACRVSRCGCRSDASRENRRA